MAVLVFASFSSANITIYVDVDGPNDPGTGSYTDPFLKIQDAINAAVAGDTVEIRPGLYTGPGNYDLDPDGKSITIRSIEPNNPDIVAHTIIDPNGAGRGFYIHSEEDVNCVVSGLTIRGACSVTSDYGGGIYCYESSPTICNCVIRDCYATDSGGGIFCSYGKPKIIKCTITSNFAEFYGGGISCYASDIEIIGCIINGNTAIEISGGLDFMLSSPVVTNCLVINNQATDGAGIGCDSSDEVRIINCNIIRNLSTDFGGGLLCNYGSSAIIENSIIINNEANQGPQICLPDNSIVSARYCNVQGADAEVYDPCGTLTWGSGNIDMDPCFAEFDPNGDPNLWDLHLQSTAGRWNSIFYHVDLNSDEIIDLVDFARLADVWLQGGNLPEDLDNSGTVDLPDMELFAQYYLANSNEDGWLSDSSTSPCIDAGDPNSDWSAEPWPNGKRINMGAYGGTSQASKNGNIADFDVSGMVSFVDFASLADKWKKQGDSIEDLSANGVIDYADVDMFAANWLWQKD